MIFQYSQDQSSLQRPLLSALQSSSGVSSPRKIEVVPSLVLLSDLVLVELQRISRHREGCELLAFLDCCRLGDRCRCKLPLFHKSGAEDMLFVVTSSCLVFSLILPEKEPSSLQSLIEKDPSDFQRWSKERTSSCLIYSFILPLSFLSLALAGKAPSDLQHWGKEMERGHVFDSSDMVACDRENEMDNKQNKTDNNDRFRQVVGRSVVPKK